MLWPLHGYGCNRRMSHRLAVEYVIFQEQACMLFAVIVYARCREWVTPGARPPPHVLSWALVQ